MTSETQPYFVEVEKGKEPTHTISTLSGDEPEATFEHLSFLSQRAGKCYLTSLYLRSWAVINRVWVFKRNKDGEIIGFLTTEPLSSIDVLEWNPHLPSNRHIHVLPPAQYLNDLVVAEETRGLGVASRMLQHVVTIGERWGNKPEEVYSTAYAISRVPIDVPEAPTSYNVLSRRCGFKDVLRMEGYYRDSHEHGFHCPVHDPLRESQPCLCTGVLMEWRRPS